MNDICIEKGGGRRREGEGREEKGRRGEEREGEGREEREGEGRRGGSDAAVLRMIPVLRTGFEIGNILDRYCRQDGWEEREGGGKRGRKERFSIGTDGN